MAGRLGPEEDCRRWRQSGEHGLWVMHETRRPFPQLVLVRTKIKCTALRSRTAIDVFVDIVQ
jgi:hypothetical protein